MGVTKIEYDYSRLNELIKDNHYSQVALADKMNIGRTSMNLKLNSRANFTQNEIYKLVHLLQIDHKDVADIFFTPVVRKTVQS